MEDLVQDLRRGSEGIDRCDVFRRVIGEQLGCDPLVECQPLTNDAFIGIVRAPLLGGALAQPLNHRFDITTDQVKNLDHLDLRIQQGSLPDSSRDTIQGE